MMKKLRVLAKVYDTVKMEFVQRYAELPVTDEIVDGLKKTIRPQVGCCPIRTGGHGSSEEPLALSTPLRNQMRFHLDPALLLIDINEETGEETVVGGWQGV